MPISINGGTYYRTSEVCKMAGISKATLFRWFTEGIIEDTMQKDRRGWRLFTMDEINGIKGEVGRLMATSSKVLGNAIDRECCVDDILKVVCSSVWSAETRRSKNAHSDGEGNETS